jgi:hypothetical protein
MNSGPYDRIGMCPVFGVISADIYSITNAFSGIDSSQ